ncbi:hypothetical protein GCM10022403_064000 [Streptomyces coacervatus]|uniref:Uncharacterized protein n=1 Tax=Streptomyces coacervatus TaxID=647381 RepID=A0ABP7IM23_9ACTN
MRTTRTVLARPAPIATLALTGSFLLAGAALGSAAGLLAVQRVEGNGDAGGVVRVEQPYATGDPLVSGRRRPLDDGSGCPAIAAGQTELPQVGRALITMAHASSG